jgi:hypothetical protein
MTLDPPNSAAATSGPSLVTLTTSLTPAAVTKTITPAAPSTLASTTAVGSVTSLVPQGPVTSASSAASPASAPVAKSSINTGAIVGGAVGGATAVGAIAFAAIVLCLRRKNRSNVGTVDHTRITAADAAISSPEMNEHLISHSTHPSMSGSAGFYPGSTYGNSPQPPAYFQPSQSPSDLGSNSPMSVYYGSGTPSQISGVSPSPQAFYPQQPGAHQLSATQVQSPAQFTQAGEVQQYYTTTGGGPVVQAGSQQYQPYQPIQQQFHGQYQNPQVFSELQGNGYRQG